MAAPGDAATPTTSDADPLTRSAMRGRCSCSSEAGSTLVTAVSRSMRPSPTMATAIFTAAAAVLFPALVWRM